MLSEKILPISGTKVDKHRANSNAKNVVLSQTIPDPEQAKIPESVIL